MHGGFNKTCYIATLILLDNFCCEHYSWFKKLFVHQGVAPISYVELSLWLIH